MKRLALAGVTLSTLLVAAAYALAFVPEAPPALGPVLLALGTAGLLAALLALGFGGGDGRAGGRGALVLSVLVVLVVVGGGLAALVLLPAGDFSDPTLVFGLPPRAALLLYGVGLLPALVVPAAYAWAFDRFTLSPEDLERVRAAGRRHRGEEGDEP